MIPLVLAIIGSLVALGGLVSLIPQVQAGQLTNTSIGAWIFRAGILLLQTGETVALFDRPEGIALKTILILSAAVTLVCLAIFGREWRQPGFALESSFSWTAVALCLAALLVAIMYIEVFVMLVAGVAAVIGVREFRRRVKADQFESTSLQNLIIAIQATIVVLTLVLLFL